MIQIGALDSQEATIYTDAVSGYPPLAKGLQRLSSAKKVIGHNIIGYDYEVIERFYPGTLRREQIVDTLMMARLKEPTERNHQLEELGKRLKVLKGTFAGPWDTVTPDMLAYAAQDIIVTRAVYEWAKEVLEWGDSLQNETDTQWALMAQERNGFRLDMDAAYALEARLRQLLADEAETVKDVFPPMWVLKDRTPFIPARDDRRMGYVAGAPVCKVTLQHFNPGSRQQVGVRLMRMGWKPKQFGKDGYPTVDEKVLGALPYPEAQRLVAYFGIAKKLGQLSDGKAAWLKLVKPDGRVYGRVIGNGAVTGRMAHSGPNMANIDSDHDMRAVWVASLGYVLVGADAAGLEARMLAHYLGYYDGGAYRDILLNGDPHTANANACNERGLPINRGGAKTLLYALMYGAQDPKLGRTVQENLKDLGLPKLKMPDRTIGKVARSAIEGSMQGLETLVKTLKARSQKQGFVKGLDGRRLKIRSAHAILNTLLQGAGAIIMKKALALMTDPNSCWGQQLGPIWRLCANVHDEIQAECLPEYAEGLGKWLVHCIVRAGEFYNLRCPLDGESKVGDNWSKTH